VERRRELAGHRPGARPRGTVADLGLESRTGDGRILARLTEPPGTLGYVTNMTFEPDGRKLALLRRNAVISIWDLAQLQAELTARGLGW
jgi:hypothetical protein